MKVLLWMVPMLLGLVSCTANTRSSQMASPQPASEQKAPSLDDNEVVLVGPLEYTAIPSRFLSGSGIAYETAGELAANLRSRGRLTLSSATLELPLRERWVIAADELRLTDSRIWTSGSHVEIVVRRLIVDDRSQLSSYRTIPTADKGGKWQKCTPTCVTHVNPPDQGAGGGFVIIRVLEEIDGLPRIKLAGGKGGQGATGNPGAKGATGERGRGARNGPFGSCERGAGDGHAGGRGGLGGPGFQGGVGGSGGRVVIRYINRPVQVGALTYFTAPGGPGGEGGEGGPGGLGGDGGLGGSNAGNCVPSRDPYLHRGASGPNGPIGPRGPGGTVGPEGTGTLEAETIPE